MYTWISTAHNMRNMRAHCALAIARHSFATCKVQPRTRKPELGQEGEEAGEGSERRAQLRSILHLHLLQHKKLKRNPWILLAHKKKNNNKHHRQSPLCCGQQQPPCIQHRGLGHHLTLARLDHTQWNSANPCHYLLRRPVQVLTMMIRGCLRLTQPILEEHAPVPGHYVSGNLWSLSMNERERQGPLGSFLRHTWSMQNVPNYVMTQKFPVRNLSDLRQEPTVDNFIVHHPYLEYLQFEQNNLRHWSNMIADQIMGKAHQAHEQLARMLARREAEQQTNAWTRTQAQQKMQVPPPPAQPIQMQPAQSTAPVQMKQAPFHHQHHHQ